MTRRLLVALTAMVAFAAEADRGAGPLAEFRWQHRVLLLYVPDGGSAARDDFRARVAARRCGIEDRDLLVGEIVGVERGRLGEAELSAARVGALRRRHDIGPERVATVLVGKDGGRKMAVDGVADLDAVFERIDGMPMRRREMAERGSPDCD